MKSSAELKHFVSAFLIAALLLIGAVPPFAAADYSWAVETEETTAAQTEAAPSETEAAPSKTETTASAEETDKTEKADKAEKAPKISGTSALIMDLKTGTVIYGKSQKKVREPASLTKILTCLVILETMDLDQVVTVHEDVETEGSVIGLEPGEKLTVEQLLYGMMLESGNDAAEVLAVAAAGSADKFCEQLNERAKACGATHTTYKNPNGLNEDRSRLNYTTAMDLALISREAMKNPKFRKIVGTSKYTIPETNMSEARKLENSNFCLWLTKEKTKINGKEVPFKYDGCNGIKTGMTSDAGYCFIGSAERNGSDFLVVVLNSEDEVTRFNDGILLWNYAFANYRTHIIQKAGTVAGVQKVRRGALRKVEVGTDTDLAVTMKKEASAKDSESEEEETYTTEFQLDNPKLTAPVKAGQKVGRVIAFDSKGRKVASEEIYTLHAVKAGGPLSYIGIADEDLPLAACGAAALLLLFILLLLMTRKKKKHSRVDRKENINRKLHKMRSSGTGMTPSELAEVTGKEEIVPIPKEPERISREELDAWSDMKPGGISSGSSVTRNTTDWKKRLSMQITPRDEVQKLLDETKQRGTDVPRRHAGLTEEEMQELLSGRTQAPGDKKRD